jgi:threonine aldolase
VLDGLERDGARFYRWPGEDSWLIRLVAGYDTEVSDVDAFLASAVRHSGAGS